MFERGFDMSITDWYKSSFNAIKNEYEKKFKEINEERLSQIKLLDEECDKRRASCSHKWVFVKGLFYFCGETWDGHQCSECLSVRRPNEKLNKIGDLKR